MEDEMNGAYDVWKRSEMCRGLCWVDIVWSGHKWEYDIKMHLVEIEWEDMGWIHLAAVEYWGGGLGVSKPPLRDSDVPPKSCQTQPDCENC